MAEKEKPEKSKPVEAKVKPPKNQKEQSARFIETARELGVDENHEKFDSAVSKIIKPRNR